MLTITRIINFTLKNKIIILLVLTILSGTIFLIPQHMDEFLMYHRYACWHESQALNTYDESCLAYQISLFNIDFHRSYLYVGITSSFLVAPFFEIFSSLYTNFLIGVFFYIGIIQGLVKSFNLNKTTFLYGILYFPLTFTLLHDAGPVKFSLLVISWTPVIVRQFIATKSLSNFFWALLLVTIWIMATEDKPFFVYLMPGCALLVLASLKNSKSSITNKNLLKSLSLLFLSALSCLLILILLRVDSRSYLHNITSSTPNAFVEVLKPAFESQSSFWIFVNYLFFRILFVVTWSIWPHRVMSLQNYEFYNFQIPFPGLENSSQFLVAILFVIGSVCGFIIFIFTLRKTFNFKVESNLNRILLFSALTFWLFALLAGGATSHHFIFGHLAFFVLVMRLIDKSTNHKFVFVAAVGALTSILAVSIGPKPYYANPEMEIVYSAAINRAESNSEISCASWGCYSQFAVLNRNSIPVLLNYTPDTRLESEAKSRNSTILIMCSGCSQNKLSENLPNSNISEINTGTTVWKLFEVVPR